MNETLRRTWPTVLVAVLALLYIWIGIVANGADRLLGITGGIVMLAGLVVAYRSRWAAMVLLAAGALPLAVTTWWSIATPFVAVLALLLGWFSVRTTSMVRHGTAVPASRPPR